MAVPIKIPLINPNEPEALIAAILVNEGQKVDAGDLICTLETTKSTADLVAEIAGYVVGLRFKSGDTVRAGDVLGYLADTPDWVSTTALVTETGGDDAKIIPDGLRITQPALELARQHNLDLTRLPFDILVTADIVYASLNTSEDDGIVTPESDFDPTAMVIYGCGGHGKAVLELLNALNTYRVVGFIDDGVSAGERVMDLSVLGSVDALDGLYNDGVRLAVNAVGGIGNLKVRKEVFHSLLEAGFVCPAIVHPTAFVEASAQLSPGVQVFPHAYVGSDVKVAFGTIINTGSTVSHDCVLGECSNISPGAILAGEVYIGNGTLIGMGVTVNLQVRIGDGARVGNGATVIQDIPDNGVVTAGSTWPKR